MKLLSILETGDNPEYREIFQNLIKKYGRGQHSSLNIADFCENGYYEKEHGYAKHIYRGVLKKDVELTELELSMICDGGYSHFGGSSSIRQDRVFTVVIYIDF